MREIGQTFMVYLISSGIKMRNVFVEVPMHEGLSIKIRYLSAQNVNVYVMSDINKQLTKPFCQLENSKGD